jgi:hypothetical protein
MVANPSALFGSATNLTNVNQPNAMVTTNYTMAPTGESQIATATTAAATTPINVAPPPPSNMMANGFQPLAQRQITETYAPPPEAQIFPPILPGAPPNIVVATDPTSMMAAGLRPIVGLPGRTNNIAPKSIGSQEGGSSNPNAKITVIRQG